MIVTEKEDNKCKINDSNIQYKTFPWSPSWGEINYFAYNLPTIEFHNELYGYLQEISGKEKQLEFDSLLRTNTKANTKTWIKEKNGVTSNEDCTVMTYIRNSIHHPENRKNNPYTQEELETSISIMLELTQEPPHAQ
jgi:hypothetical protein